MKSTPRSFLHRCLAAIAALLLPPLCLPASADDAKALGAPPDGAYNCIKISGDQLISLGKLEIRGRTYRGMAGGEFAPFTLDADNAMVLGKGLTGMPDGWTLLSVKYTGNDKEGRPLIKIAYRSKSGFNDLIDAVMEGAAKSPARGAAPPAGGSAPPAGGTLASHRKAITDALNAAPDVKARNLLFLKGLAEGKSWADASAGKRTDPDTLATYESLTPDARKKLALNFAGKVQDPAMVEKLAGELNEGKPARASHAPSPGPGAPAPR